MMNCRQGGGGEGRRLRLRRREIVRLKEVSITQGSESFQLVDSGALTCEYRSAAPRFSNA